jgi:hypothetical protein
MRMTGPSVFRMLALGTLLLATPALRAEDYPLPQPDILPMPAFDACTKPADGRADYVAALMTDGWAEIPDTDRPTAIATLADAMLPFSGGMEDLGTDLLARRADMAEETKAFINDRAILQGPNGEYLLLAGFGSEDGSRLIECYIALPDDTITNAFFDKNGPVDPVNNIRSLVLNGQPDETGFENTLTVVQFLPDTPAEPPLLSHNALLTQLTIPPTKN